jgi:transposase-like protein
MCDLPDIAGPVETLERLVREEKDAQIQRRFQMLLLLKTGEAKSRSGAARQLDVHRHTVSDWFDLYEEGGIEKIQEVGDPGPEPGQESPPASSLIALVSSRNGLWNSGREQGTPRQRPSSVASTLSSRRPAPIPRLPAVPAPQRDVWAEAASENTAPQFVLEC